MHFVIPRKKGYFRNVLEYRIGVDLRWGWHILCCTDPFSQLTGRWKKLIEDDVKPVANVILVRPHMANSETDVEHVWPGHSQDASIFIILKYEYVVKASWTPEDPCNEHVQVAQPTFVAEWQNHHCRNQAAEFGQSPSPIPLWVP